MARAPRYGNRTHVTVAWAALAQGWSIVRRAIKRWLWLVTNNTTDFTSLLRREKVHAGLVCLNVAHALMRPSMSEAVFALALIASAKNEPINEMLEISLMKIGRSDRAL